MTCTGGGTRRVLRSGPAEDPARLAAGRSAAGARRSRSSRPGPPREAGGGRGGTGRGGDPVRELQELDAVFKALAHPARRRILLVLHFRGGIMSSREIAGRFACAWPTTTRHLGVLKEAGLVRVVRQGRQRRYELEPGRMDRVRSWLDWFRRPALVQPSFEAEPPET